MPPPIADCIRFTLPDGSNGEFGLDSETISIGSAPDNDVVFADGSVSRHHAEIRRSPSGYQIVDLGSTNGIKAQGVSVGETPLHFGTPVYLGAVLLTPDTSARMRLHHAKKRALQRKLVRETIILVVIISALGFALGYVTRLLQGSP